MSEAGGAGASDLGPQVSAELDRSVPEGALGVAVSGGGDSITLLTIAADWARRRGRGLHAATVDHGLRPESAAEAAFAGNYAARLGVAHRVLRAGPMGGGNLSAAAREARYALLADWARDTGLSAVALGHTMDDQAETVLMRLARGAGAEGLSAMAIRRDWGEVVWVRPMLAIRRAALRAWLRAHGIAWADDPTNEDIRYDRVKARRALAVLEPLGITVEGLADTARTLARQRRVLTHAAAELEAAAVTHGAFGEARIALTPLGVAERDTALRVLAGVLTRVGGRHYRPRFRALSPALDGLLAGGRETMTLAGCLVMIDPGEGYALICREPAAVEDRVRLRDGTVWDGKWQLRAPAGFDGDWRVGALGVSGRACLDRLVREGAWQPPAAWSAAPRLLRETLPAIFAGTGFADTGDASLPVAVPSAGWTAIEAPPGLSKVAASLVTSMNAAG